MELNEIEHKIATNEMTAAQVFTQMKQHIDAANKEGWNGAVLGIIDMMGKCQVDADIVRDEYYCP